MSRMESDVVDSQLLEWLEGFTERLKGRTNAVAEEVQQVVDEMGAVELNLQNTFNSFRCLSSSQYVEHHVYEEDETDLITTGISKKDPKHLPMPTESYEDEILPRYKDAVATAWAAFQGAGRQDDQTSLRRGSRKKLQGERSQILPLIIGSQEFTRDIHCGLADLRRHDEPESDSDGEEDTAAGLVAEPVETGILSDGEMSGTESDVFDSQKESLEPAVSAALDFKAMLEAALRNPSLPYDGGPSNDSSFGEFADNKFSLPSLTDDYLNDSPRNISTMVDIIGRTMSTMDESKEEFRGNASQQSNATVGSSQPPLATEPPAVLDDRTPSSTFAELLKSSLTGGVSNQQYVDDNNGSSQGGTGDLSHVPFIPGGLFGDDAPDSGFPAKENALVFNSNTGPSIPEGLFQEQLSTTRIQRTRSTSRSSNSFDSSQSLPLHPPSLADIVPKPSSDQDSDSALRSEKNGSNKFQMASSLIPKQASLQPSSSSISSGSNAVLGSQQTGQFPIRGGLFDDDDEDEDDGDLFGAPAPRVDSQPVLPPWASRSSKGLFDDIASERGGTSLISDEAEEWSSREAPRPSDIFSSIASQDTRDSAQEALDLSKQPVESSTHVGRTESSPDVGKTESSPDAERTESSTHVGNTESTSYVGSTQVDIGTFSGPEETVSSNPRDVKEDLQLPIQSAVAAAIRSSVPFVAESDDDSWSGSESGVENVSEGRTLAQRLSHEEDASILVAENIESGAEGASFAENSESGAEGASILVVENSESGAEDASPNRTAEGIIDSTPEVPLDSDHLAQSPSDAEEILTGDVLREEEESSVVSSQTVMTPARFPPAIPRLVSTGPSPVKAPINVVDNPLLPSKTSELSDAEAEASDSSDSATSSGGFQDMEQRQAVRSMFPGTPSLSENPRLSASQAASLGNETQSSSAQSSRENLISEDLSKASSTSLPPPASEIGRSTTRTFIPLFDDDDAEEDLLFQAPSKRQGASTFTKTGQGGIALSSDSTRRISAGQERSVESESPSTTPDVHPQLPPPVSKLSDPPTSSRSSSFANKEGDLSAKSGSKLSSLLFGDDDEDDEDALFGPLGGRASRGLKFGKGGSIFGDAN